MTAAMVNHLNWHMLEEDKSTAGELRSALLGMMSYD
jgi:hypothetical protein